MVDSYVLFCPQTRNLILVLKLVVICVHLLQLISALDFYSFQDDIARNFMRSLAELLVHLLLGARSCPTERSENLCRGAGLWHVGYEKSFA